MRARVLSGMRPTGALHLGHYHGALKNWVRLQHEYDSFFFVADWHALTTHYQDRAVIERNVYDMVVDWIAAGLDPDLCTIFIQSRLPEHAELFTLLSMGTPLGWLERVPTYKDQIEHWSDRGPGDLRLPRLPAAAGGRHPDLQGDLRAGRRGPGFARRADARGRTPLQPPLRPLPGLRGRVAAALAKLPPEQRALIERQRKDFGQDGDAAALGNGEALVRQALAGPHGFTPEDAEVLLGHLKGSGRAVLTEPKALHTEVTRLPGLDGQKMSKSYGNAIEMREEPAQVEAKIRKMPTDPQRVRRTDAGDPARCPVWQFHKVYSDIPTQAWAQQGCTTAGIGCLDCKQPVIDAILREQQPWRERAEAYLSNPKHVHWIVEMGTERARTVARQTMKDVRDVMGLSW